MYGLAGKNCLWGGHGQAWREMEQSYQEMKSDSYPGRGWLSATGSHWGALSRAHHGLMGYGSTALAASCE